jgi:hypothetical protein
MQLLRSHEAIALSAGASVQACSIIIDTGLAVTTRLVAITAVMVRGQGEFRHEFCAKTSQNNQSLTWEDGRCKSHRHCEICTAEWYGT